MTDDLKRLLRETFEYAMTDVHTCFPGSVVSYDAKTRRAEIQPYMKRKMPDGSFLNFPVLPDIPVLYFGTKKYTMHLPLEKDDEVMVMVCERCTDVWRDNGAVDNEDPDPRRFSIMDCFVIPGLQPQEFIGVEEAGIVIKHHTNWDGDFISHVIIDDDKIEAKYKKKCQVTMTDDKIFANTEHCSMEMTKKDITVTNSISTLRLREDKFSEKNKTQSLYKILKDWMQQCHDEITFGSPAVHKTSPKDKLALQVLMKRLDALMEA
uniref:Phage protein Gp138 N-terminal domain-containing protein n=1 Tax=uncultured bacterium contig00055 TaxID=1181539 RepID=A0A806KK96_9BACT|nr:hypothetical protein [uncultured bacterium contig00055]